MALKALALNATLKPSGSTDRSSTEKLLLLLAQSLGQKDIVTETIRLADYDIKPGVSSDEGKGDAWPGIRQRILDADILLIGTPIWLGQPSSICKRVLERMDAFLDETDDKGRMLSYGRLQRSPSWGTKMAPIMYRQNCFRP